jgi:PAS domain-containing protein
LLRHAVERGRQESLVNREECSERIRLTDEYSRLITEFNGLLDALKAPRNERNDEAWKAAEIARTLSQKAWDALEKHITDHNCMELHWNRSSAATSSILEMAALAALDVILVANDDRRFIDANDAAAAALGLPRNEIVGRRIDEFFASASGKTIPVAWEGFIADGIQSGICELTPPRKPRKFEYRAKANFAPGLHLSVMRELKED